jgi:hypothetical protein
MSTANRWPLASPPSGGASYAASEPYSGSAIAIALGSASAGRFALEIQAGGAICRTVSKPWRRMRAQVEASRRTSCQFVIGLDCRG